MYGFVDEVIIEVSSGDGGDGAVSFRREKYVPKGGPDGGDGGRGGDVVFVVKDNVRTLSYLKLKRHFKAKNGQPGRGSRMHGKDGESVEIDVPRGTILRDPGSKDVIRDFSVEGERWVFLEGGNGGMGNWNFRSSTNQTPRYATPGKSGKLRKVMCELQVIADVGLVGFPNAGKSMLLSVLTNATPKIAAYPFTTLSPNLGILQHKGREVVLADIPGIIEGASQGVGLGITFLRHIQRTKLLAFMLDAAKNTCLADYEILVGELRKFSPALLERKRIVIFTKKDIADPDWMDEIPEEQVIRKINISSVTGDGIRDLADILIECAGRETG